MNMRSVLWIFASAGLLVPLMMMFLFSRALPSWTMYVWPSYILLGATIEREWAVNSIVLVGISILLNVFLYVIIGFALLGIWFLIKRMS